MGVTESTSWPGRKINALEKALTVKAHCLLLYTKKSFLQMKNPNINALNFL